MKLTILGSIGSGKSTVSKYLAELLNLPLFEEKYLDNPFLTDFYEAIAEGKTGREFIFPLQIFFLNYYKRKALEVNLRKEYISDTNCLAGLAFVTAQVNQGQMTKEIGELYFELWKQSFLEMGLLDRKAKYVLIDREVGNIMDMITSRGREYEKGMPVDYINELRNSNFLLVQEMKKYGINIQVVHVKAGTSVEDVAKQIMEKLND